MLEIRSFDLEDAGLYDGGRKFHGRSVVFDRPAELTAADGSTITESIAPEAFRSSLATRTPVLLHEHQAANLLARRSVVVKEVGDGLDVDAELVDTDFARSVAALIKAEEITGMSFGFLPAQRGFVWERRGTGVHRTLRAGTLLEMSTVVLPVYAGTTAAVRSITIPQHLARPGRDIERWGALLDRLSA